MASAYPLPKGVTADDLRGFEVLARQNPPPSNSRRSMGGRLGLDPIMRPGLEHYRPRAVERELARSALPLSWTQGTQAPKGGEGLRGADPYLERP